MSDYRQGYRDGYHDAMADLKADRGFDVSRARTTRPDYMNLAKATKKVKRKQSGKAKLLTAMTAPVWKKYKKGSGKKTYVQIRAKVSRSLDYKRKAKKL
jgi:hypothetical protein